MNPCVEAPQITASLIFALIFLIPMVPAAFFFWKLDSTAIVAGPLKGFNMNFGGSFAAYFATALLAVSTYPLWKPLPLQPEVWTVQGTVLDDKGQPMKFLNDGDIKIYPVPSPPADGNFIMSVSFPTKGPYPRLYISHKGYLGPTIDLDPSEKCSVQLHRDAVSKTIKLREFKLQRQAEYAPTVVATPLSPTSTSGGAE